MLIRTVTPYLVESIVIREAVPEDVRGVRSLIQSKQKEPNFDPNNLLNTLGETPEETATSVQQVNDDPQSLILIAEAISLSQVIGVLLCRNTTRATKQHIVSFGFYIRRDWYSKGLSANLVREGIRWAQRHEILNRIEVEIMSHDSGLLQFYKQLGFRVEGRTKGAVRVRDRYMDTFWLALSVNEQSTTLVENKTSRYDVPEHNRERQEKS